MAAELKNEPGVQVETVKGGLGEFAVSVGDRKVIKTSRLWYPNPSEVVKRVKALLAEQS